MSEWIPVSERLPEDDIIVKVLFDDDDGGEDVGIYTKNRVCMLAGYAGGSGYFGEGWATEDRLITDPPLAWKPRELPEPYKGEG